MLKNLIIFLKYFIVAFLLLIVVISCEKDFTIGNDLMNNNAFSTGKHEASAKANTIRILKNRTDAMSVYLLGYLNSTTFGSLKASIATQLTLPEINPDFGENAVIDSVVITIPYFYHLDGTQDAANPVNPSETIKVPNFELDSVYTAGTNKNFHLKVYELGTYLNELNPENPEEANTFYSNENFATIGDPLFDGLISPNRNDTMMVVNRYQYEDETLTNRILYKKDTIKLESKSPSLKITLNEQKIKEIFQDNAESFHFASNVNFHHFFRGLYFETSDSGEGEALMNLNFSGAFMTIFYTETQVKDEAVDEDLDDDGIMGELNVIIPKAASFVYKFADKIVNIYDRNYENTEIEDYLLNPNILNGDDKFYVQGSAGLDAKIRLFGDDTNNNTVPDELEALRSNNWLINDAKLYLYVNSPSDAKLYPERLYLYAIEGDEKKQTYEVMHQGEVKFGGTLVYNEDDEPDYYLFHLTDYISELLKSNEDVNVVDFGLKTYSPQDSPQTVIDTIMKEYNHNFKGVVLTGNTDSPRKLKLEIFYTEKN